jgi:thiamine kinase-like enzyme
MMQINQNLLFNKIQSDFLKFSQKIIDIKIIYARHSTVCEVLTKTESYIFKFPISEASYDIKREAHILEFLKNKIEIEIPQISFIGKTSPYIGYKKINKAQMTIEKIKQSNNKEYSNIFDQIAHFLHSIHLTSSEIKPTINIQVNPAEKYPENILRYIKNTETDIELGMFAKEIVGQYLEKGRNCYNKPQFVYNDLHLGNLLIGDDGKIAVIDFGFCSIGDIHREFHQFHKYSEVYLNDLVNRYCAFTDMSIDIKYVELISKIDQLNYYFSLLYSQKQNNQDSSKYLSNVKSVITNWMKTEG